MRTLLIIAVWVFNICVNAQVNLVPNPSFEFNTICPYDQSQLSFAYPWFNSVASSTPDYYNRCFDTILNANVDVPLNSVGFQEPHSGDAYAGFISIFFDPNTSTPTEVNRREYLTVKLNEKLKPCYDYRVELYVSLSSLSLTTNPSSGVGVFFSETPIYRSIVDPSLIDTIPSISYTDNYIYDTVGWTKIEDIYTASGNEEYMTIGIFSSDFETNLAYQIAGFNYYYVDDVGVYEIAESTTCGVFQLTNVFTPNGDGVNDLFLVKSNNLIQYQLQIFNRWGNLLFESNDTAEGWNGRYNESEVADGTYYYIIRATGEDNKSYLLKGFVTLIR